jgi:hypothetical protein
MSITLVLRDGSTFIGEDNEQVFSFDADSGGQLHMCVPALAALHRRQPERWRTLTIPLEPEDATTLIRTRGIELAHVAEMELQRAQEPGYAIFLEDGSFLVVDGNHRYVFRCMAGMQGMSFHTCAAPDWHAALIDVEATQKLLKGEPQR